MSNIVDISGFQPCNKIDWATFSKNVDLLIMRVQYGSTVPDSEYANHVSCAKQYNIPFLSYAFPEFVSVNDARVEARDAVSRQDKDSLGMVIDIESEFNGNGNPLGITKLSNQVRLDGIKAYVDELRKAGIKKVGAYIAHGIYLPWGINTIISLFDFVWIPKYGANDGQPHTKPDFPCDLWQYTSVGRVPGYAGDLDLSVLNGGKSLDWFTGKGVVQVNIQAVSNSDYVGKTLTSKVDGLWYYNTPKWDKCDGTSNKGDQFIIMDELMVNGGRMLKCHDGKYRTADPKYVDVNPKPLEWPYTVVVDNITLKDAQEICKLLQPKYPNTNGIAK